MAKKRQPAKKKPARKRPALKIPKTPVSAITPEQQIVGAQFLGKVRDYYAQIGVAALVLEAPLAVGDVVRIKGHTTDLTQRVEQLEIDHETVQSAAPGEGVGLKIADRARIGDAVYKL